MSVQKKKSKSIGRVNRSVARLAAVQALYELEMSAAPLDDVLLEFVRDRWETQRGGEGERLAEPDKELFLKIVRGVSSDKKALGDILNESLSGEWTTERLEVVLRVILFAGLFELKTLLDVPPKVVINEYMEVAKAFFDAGEVAMVNGVLDKMASILRKGEMVEVAEQDGNER